MYFSALALAVGGGYALLALTEGQLAVAHLALQSYNIFLDVQEKDEKRSKILDFTPFPRMFSSSLFYQRTHYIVLFAVAEDDELSIAENFHCFGIGVGVIKSGIGIIYKCERNTNYVTCTKS